MASGQVSVLQNFKQIVPTSFSSIEYTLLATILSLLALKKWFGWSVGSFRLDKEFDKEKNYNFDNLPGPSRFPIIGSLHHISDLKNTINMFHDYGKRFGPVIRFDILHEKVVILNSAPMAQMLLQSTEMGHGIKSPIIYDTALKEILGKGLITSAGERWKSQRKLLNPAFSYRSFQNYSRLFIKYSAKLVNDLDMLFQSSDNGNKTKTINSTIHSCSMRIISEAVMGLDLCNDNDGLNFYNSVRKVKEMFGIRLNNPLLMVDFFWKLHPLYKEYIQAAETINMISKRMIIKHKNGKEQDAEKTESILNSPNEEISKGKTMIEEMLAANMSVSDMMYEVNSMIFAGFETTGAAVHYLMLLLALNPDQQKLCREEVDETFDDPIKCPNGELTFDAIVDFKYVERCVYETLRLFPPIFGFFRKLEKTLKMTDKLIIPKGANIALPPLTLHMNPEYFPNPEKFDPDRFLPENSRKRHPYAFIAFSSGQRNCIGTKFAIMEIKAMAAQILRNFEVYTTDKLEDVNLLPNIFLTPERDYNFILKRRRL